MKSFLAQFSVFVIALFMVAPMTPAAELSNSFNLGIGGVNPMPHCDAKVFIIEYEHPLTPAITLLGRGSGVNYTDDDSDYLEDGKLRGLDIGARYYPARRMQGLYTGGSLGYWAGDWTFIENRHSPNQMEGEADTHSLRVNFDLGYRFPITGTNISIMPEVNLGKFISSSSCEYTAPASQIGASCSQKSDVDFYLFAGVIVGFAF